MPAHETMDGANDARLQGQNNNCAIVTNHANSNVNGAAAAIQHPQQQHIRSENLLGMPRPNKGTEVELRVTRDFNHHRFSGIFPCHHRFSVFFSDFYSASAYGVVQMHHAA